MKHIQPFLLVAIWSLFYSFAVNAEGEGDAGGIEAEDSTPENIMMRESSPLLGYQPITVAGQEIEATYLEEKIGQRHGAIVLLHDQNEQLESHGVITPLRHHLPQYGWSTLTIALDYPFEPKILLSPTQDGSDVTEQSDNESKSAEKVSNDVQPDPDEVKETDEKAIDPLPPISNQQRIEAVIAFLQAKGIDKIIFVAHGAGGLVAIELLDILTRPISALILIGTQKLDTDKVFETFNFPVLDLYGNKDKPAIVEAVKHRKAVMTRTGNKHYEIRELVGADHVFYGVEAQLVTTVRGWLRKRFVAPVNN